MNAKIEEKFKEIDVVLTQLRLKRLELIKVAFETCEDIKSLSLSYDEDSNDEGGSYRTYYFDSINDVSLDSYLSSSDLEYWDEDGPSDDEADLKTFVIENNIKLSSIKEVGDVIFSFDDAFLDSLNDTVRLADINREIEKLTK